MFTNSTAGCGDYWASCRNDQSIPIAQPHGSRHGNLARYWIPTAGTCMFGWMKRLEHDVSAGIWALPSFPVVLVTAGENAMTAGAFHFYSFDPPSVMVGIMPDKYTHSLITEYGDFGINIPRVDQIQAVHLLALQHIDSNA